MFPLGDFFKKSKNQEEKDSSDESAPPPAAHISQLLSSATILISKPPEKKSGLLNSLVQMICKVDPSIPFERSFQSVMEREKVTSTFMDTGVAVPHARISKIEKIHAALAILPDGFVSSKQPNFPKTHFVFLFLSPEKQLSPHLQTLSKVSWLLQKPTLKEKLLKAESPDEVLSLIQQSESEGTHGSTTFAS